jgi:hypothetical protein
MNKEKSIYEVLSSVDVSSKIEKKGDGRYSSNYMSWGHAWNELKKLFPEAKRNVYEDPNTGLIYFSDGRYGYVKVGIEINGIEMIDYLPIMDNRNNSIPVEKITSFDVNKTIQRSTTKAIAMHGLGISLWLKEEEPSDEDSKSAKPAGKKLITLNVGGENWSRVLKYVEANNHLSLEEIISNLKSKYTVSAGVKKEIKSNLESNG